MFFAFTAPDLLFCLVVDVVKRGGKKSRNFGDEVLKWIALCSVNKRAGVASGTHTYITHVRCGEQFDQKGFQLMASRQLVFSK